MSARIKMAYLWLILRWAVGLLFIAASVYKILYPGAFAHQIYNYRLLPTWAINPLAIGLPWLQLFTGLCLILNRWTEAASFIIVVLMFVFQIALVSALFRGLNISCGCFKSGGDPATWLTFGRDFVIFIMALLNFIQQMTRRPSKNKGLWMSPAL